MIVDAPNGGHPKPQQGFLGAVSREFYSQQFAVPVGPPPAKLAIAVIEPRNYGFGASAEWGKNRDSLVLQWHVGNAPASTSRSKPPQASNESGKESQQEQLERIRRGLARLPVCQSAGTVILLPGWGEDKETLLGYALDFANHGYRVVLVDLRGQGASSGGQVTYGLIERHDIAQLVSALKTRGLVAGKIALVGFSEGATIALDAAADDPDLSAVVAAAPFVSLRTAITGVGRDFMPQLSKMVSDEKLDDALEIADRKTGMNLADSDPTARVGNISAPVLYIAGGSDDVSSAADVRMLAAKTPHARFVELPHYPHVGVYFDVATIGPLTLDLLSEELGKPVEPACIAAPFNAPEDAQYHFKFTFEIKRRK